MHPANGATIGKRVPFQKKMVRPFGRPHQKITPTAQFTATRVRETLGILVGTRSQVTQEIPKWQDRRSILEWKFEFGLARIAQEHKKF